MTTLLDVDAITCGYDGVAVVEDFSFGLNEGEIACLLGPSGCGKTTALRAIAGFVQPSAGAIALRSQTIASANFSLPPDKRRVGMVFQDYARFPHLDVCDIVTFGLRGKTPREKERVCEELLTLVKLQDMGQRFPHELSCGQQLRIDLARALAPEPALRLIDEPFSIFDCERRLALALDDRRSGEA